MGKPAWQSGDYRKEAKARKEIEKMDRENDQIGLIVVMRDAPAMLIRVAAAHRCKDCDALINVALKENEAFYVRAAALESIGKNGNSSHIIAIVSLLKTRDYILPTLAAIYFLDKQWLENNGTDGMTELIKSSKAAGNTYSHWADGFIEVIKKADKIEADQTKRNAPPEDMPASDLIDYMTEHRTSDNFVNLGYILAKKLKTNFRSSPEDIKKALFTFCDSGMAARFDMIYGTMQPDDIDLLMPDLLKNYMMRNR